MFSFQTNILPVCLQLMAMTQVRESYIQVRESYGKVRESDIPPRILRSVLTCDMLRYTCMMNAAMNDCWPRIPNGFFFSECASILFSVIHYRVTCN